MLTYSDAVIEHVDFYGSAHTHCVVVHRRTQHASQIEHVALRCRPLPYGNAIVPSDNNGK